MTRARALGAVVVVAAVAVALFLGLRDTTPSPAVALSRDGSFPARGSFLGDRAAIDEAVAAWRDADGRRTPELQRVTEAPVQVLYAGQVRTDRFVLLRQGDRVIALERGEQDWSDWEVEDAVGGFDPRAGVPVAVGDVVLLPGTGDWTFAPGEEPGTVTPVAGLLVEGGPDGSPLEHGLVLDGARTAWTAAAGPTRLTPAAYADLARAASDPRGVEVLRAALGRERAPSGVVDVVWVEDDRAVLVPRDGGDVRVGWPGGPEGRTFGRPGEAVSATFLRDELLVAGGAEVARLVISIDGARQVVPGPVALVPGRLARFQGDVEVSGLDADGRRVGEPATPDL